jgi:hypothetical protein
VVGFHHSTAQRNGKKLDVHCCLAFQLEDGRSPRAPSTFFDLYAWDEFWSQPGRREPDVSGRPPAVGIRVALVIGASTTGREQIRR